MKEKNIKLIIIISIVSAIVLSATFAFLFLGGSGSSDEIQAGCFKVNYSGQAIDTSELISTTDYKQGAKSDIVLSKDAECEIYNEAKIYVHTEESTTAPISDGALKYKIIQGETEVGTGSVKEVGDNLLATIPLSETETAYTVYLWIDSSVSNGSYNGTTYKGHIYATSTQNSTIDGTHK